jgi:hypothetical protein
MRGRNNRKGPNPLTRTYESNGPDVKIRGTAHHVAEKYLQLARDAQSSGDPVMAESYLQHAEHYFRLIAAAQAAQQQAQMGFNRPEGAPDPDDMDDDDDIGGLPDRFASPVERFQPQAFGNGQQPYAPQQGGFPQQQQPYQGERQPQQAAPQGQPQPFIERPAFPQQQQPYQGERQPRGDRPYQDRNNNQQGGGRFQNRNNRFRGDQQPRPDMEQDTAPNGLPAFITSPSRVADQDQPAPAGGDIAQQHQEVEAGGYHLRPRRRRRPREDGDMPPGDNAE